MTSVRMDKWLWAARFFKTRALAARACQLGRIQCNGQPAKPARERGLLFVGDLLVAHDEHPVAVHQRAHAVERCVVERAQIGPGELAHEQRVELLQAGIGRGHTAHDGGASS